MALCGVSFGLGFTFGPLLGALALLGSGEAHLSPWPGYAAGVLSAAAFCLAWFRFAESIPGGVAAHAREHVDLVSLRQCLTVPSIGLLLAVLFFTNFDHHYYRKLAKPILAIAWLMLVYVIVQHRLQHNPQPARWLSLGLISIQVSDVARLAFIIFMADFLHRMQPTIQQFRETILRFLP